MSVSNRCLLQVLAAVAWNTLDWLIDCLIDWLIDWLIATLYTTIYDYGNQSSIWYLLRNNKGKLAAKRITLRAPFRFICMRKLSRSRRVYGTLIFMIIADRPEVREYTLAPHVMRPCYVYRAVCSTHTYTITSTICYGIRDKKAVLSQGNRAIPEKTELFARSYSCFGYESRTIISALTTTWLFYCYVSLQS